jgi:hypothetical protein
MLIIMNNKQFERMTNLMSQFLDDARAILERVAQGNASDPAMKADIADLKAAMNDNDASDQEVKTLLTEILNKLAASTPPTP